MVRSEELVMSDQLRPMENPEQCHDSELRVNDTREQEVVTGDQSSEMKQEEDLEVFKDFQQSNVEVAGAMSSEHQTQTVEGATGFSFLVTEEDVVIEYDPSMFTQMPTEGVSSGSPFDGETAQLIAVNDFSQLNEDEESNKRRKGKGKLDGSVISSWSLRSKSQEKDKSPDPSEPEKEKDEYREEKRGRKRKLASQNNRTESFRTKTHLRYLLHRIKYEQSLIDAYSAEGWKGQSLEKLKPEKELQRAKSNILRYKLKIRALFEHLDQSLSVGKIPDDLFDPEGDIDSEDIFCAKCGSKDLTLDNDIILCDGACVRGFHQYCLEPPLLKEHIPPGDESWICPECECKQDCLDMLKDYHSTKVLLTDSWESIFPEAARAASGNNLETVSGSLDDSEDDDYDPNKPEVSTNDDDDDHSSSNKSGCFSAPDDPRPGNKEVHLQGLPSDDSEDGDFDPCIVHQEKAVESDSSDFTSDSEDLGALLQEEMDDQKLPPTINQTLADSEGKQSAVDVVKRDSLAEELSHLHENIVEPISGKRRVERLDYKKLHDEAFGNYSSDSSDEDFEENSEDEKRTGNHHKTLKTPNHTPFPDARPGSAGENFAENSDLPKKTCKNTRKMGEQMAQSGSADEGSRRSSTYKRLGEAVTQKLYSSFLENKYPDRSVKENLSHELGISLHQVSKWFENARWSFKHRPQAVSSKTQNSTDNLSAQDVSHSAPIVGLQKPDGISASENHSPVGVENSIRETKVDESELPKTRDRQDAVS